MRFLRMLAALFAAGASKQTGTTTYDPILDWQQPSPQDVQQIRQSLIEPMQSLTSAVFFSTDQDGKRHESLQHIVPTNIPADDGKKNKPILFVSNHQLVGIDSFLVVAELWNCGIKVRALTHPFLSNLQGDFTLPGSSMYGTFGCLPVSPRTFYKLMKSNQPTLLFPGGARESFHKSNEQYTLTGWAIDGDFVRTAAKFNATIIPFSSVGAAESAFFLDQLPFADVLGDALLRAAVPTEGAPYNARYDGGEPISFPMVLPKPLPSRHYFLFDKSIDLSTVDYKNRDDCRQIYQQIKQRIQRGCQDLVQAKSNDPYNDNPLQRVAYEQFWRKRAPTFSADLLNE